MMEEKVPLIEVYTVIKQIYFKNFKCFRDAKMNRNQQRRYCQRI